jgi:hypothetical protein
MQYVNFYETLAEANMRLRGTYVLYDGLPYAVLCITNHKDDGIFRIYIEPLGFGETSGASYMSMPSPHGNFSSESTLLGSEMDKWMASVGDGCRVLRKTMNSPLFNKFRPFPLGMYNSRERAFYLERQPNRRSEQGLTYPMISFSPVFSNKGRVEKQEFNFYSSEFKSCVIGSHPSAQDCLDALNNPEVGNESVAFHRNFAFVRGPLEVLFLAYKSDIVAVLPDCDFSAVRLGKQFSHTREVVEDLGLFNKIL